MKNPFIYGHLSDYKSFLNRTDDITRLKQNINNQIHTIILSPRRWGKSSLIKVLEQKIGPNKNTIFCHLDMFNIQNKQDFIDQYINIILKKSSSKFEEWMSNIKDFLSKIKPDISLDNDNFGKISIGIEQSNSESNLSEALDLAENIAKKKKIKFVICIDEFQNIENISNSIGFQQQLRASWQHHQNVVYVLYGSKRHMMSSLFEKQSMPFYKFGDIFYLQKIAPDHFHKYIIKKFKDTNKKITQKFAKQITELMESHTYYVLQFSHIVWNNTEHQVDNDTIKESIEDIIGRNSLFFETIYDNTSLQQRNTLRMLIEDKSGKLTSLENVHKYNFGSSSNVIQSLNALENKEIIDKFEGTPKYADPVFRLWLKQKLY
jgi:hypothetical protein